MLHMMYHGHGRLNRFEGFFRFVSRICQAQHIYHTFWDFGTARAHELKHHQDTIPQNLTSQNAFLLKNPREMHHQLTAIVTHLHHTQLRERQSKTTTTTTLPSALSLWGRNLTSSGSSWNPSKQWGSQETHWRLSHPPCWENSTTNCSSRRLHATKDELGPSHGHGYGCTHNPPAPVIKIATNFLAPSNYTQKRINNYVTICYWMPNAKPYDENGQLSKRRNAACNLSHTHAYPPAPVLKITANQLP